MNAVTKFITLPENKKRNERELTAEELMLVAGGSDTIVVYGGAGSDNNDGWDYWDYNDSYDDYDTYDNYGDGGGGGDAPETGTEGLTEDQQLVIQTGIAVLAEDLADKIEEFGDFDIKIGDLTFKASDLLKSLEKLDGIFTLYEGYQLTNDILNGDASLGDAIGFLGALAIGAGAAALGGGPIAVLTASYLAGALLPGAIDGVVEQLDIAYHNMLNSAVDSVGYQPADPTTPPIIQEYDLLQQLFGHPYLREYRPHSHYYNIP